MPRKTEDVAFLKNHLRIFIQNKSAKAPTPATRFRAMLMLAALNNALSEAVIHDLSDPTPPKLYQRGQEEIPETPTPQKDDPRLQAMLTTADKLKGGANGDKLPESGS